MLEPSADEYNEQIAQLQAELTRLQQENAELRTCVEFSQLEPRSQLQTREQSQTELQSDDPDSALEYRLLIATAMAVNALLAIDNFDAAVNAPLQAIGESLDTDRVGVIENFAPAPNPSAVGWRVLYEWTSPHAIAQITHPELSTGTWEGIEDWYERLSQGQGFSYLLEELPEPFRSGQAELGLKALHAVPIFVEGEYWGAAAFDDCRVAKRRSTAELTALKITADCIGSTIQHQRTQQALSTAEREQAAIAREQEQAAQSRVAELAKTNDALKGSLAWLVKNPDLDSFLDHLLLEITRQVNAAIGQIFLFDANTKTLNFQIEILDGQIYKQPRLAEPELFQAPIPADITPLFQYLCENWVIFVSTNEFDRIVWPGTRDWLQREGMSEGVCLALMVGERPVGLIGLGFRDRSTLQPEDLEIIYALVHQVTLAIRLTQLAEEAKQVAISREQEQAAQQRVAEIVRANDALQRTVGQLAAETELNTFLSFILHETAEQLEAWSSALLLYDSASETLSMTQAVMNGETVDIATDPRFEVWRAPVPAALTAQWRQRRLQMKLGDPIYGRIAETDPYVWTYTILWNQRMGHQGFLSVPLPIGSQVLGSILVAFRSATPPSAEKIELVRVLAQQTAMALHMTRLAEQGKQAAISEERNRMAREIHDTLAQSFTSIKMQLEAATRLLSRQPEQAQICITTAQELAKVGLAEARRSVWALQPEAGDYRHLSTTLQRLAAQQTAETSISVEVRIVGTPYALSPDVGMHLLRIGQEALNNAIRHASAQIILTLTYAPHQIQLQIQDDGQGFDPQQTSSGGFGLIGMQQRSDRLGGTFVINSQIGHGTEVRVTVPVQKENERD